MLNRSIACLSFLLASVAFAQPPANAPAGSTGLCKDGTYTSSATKRGACSGHQGVQTWYGAGTANAPATVPKGAAPSGDANTPPATPQPASSTSAATPGAPATVPKMNATPGQASTSAPAQTAAPAGSVWVNTKTKVYHCSGDRWYGKTKQGQYMSESDAVAQGDRPDHGKACH
jgi:hypothetical protein